MRIFLVTRGSHGDVYPYLEVTAELVRRGHYITLSIPRMFEDVVKRLNFNYVLQADDDINGLIEGTAKSKGQLGHILRWTRKVIDQQFIEFIPFVKEHDIFVASNTEFSAVSIAEYCKKPLIRTAYAPLIPSKTIRPPIMPLSGVPKFIPASILWNIINSGANFMARTPLNKNRKLLGMSPIKKYAPHAAGNANNFLMYSPNLGEIDPTWKYPWKIGGYCFNNSFSYDEETYSNLASFIKKDNKPTLFFTLGSCNSPHKDDFCERLLETCNELEYKLIVGSGWYKTGANLNLLENLFILDKTIPHNIVFSLCDAIIHHGGSGTTHSCALAGKPQSAVALIIDQDYWASRIKNLKLGFGKLNITSTKDKVKKQIQDLIENPLYRRNAQSLAEKIQQENGVKNICDYIESFDKNN